MDNSGKRKGTLSAPVKTVHTEIITCTITLLVQLKGVKELIKWLALQFLFEITWQLQLLWLLHLLSCSFVYLEEQMWCFFLFGER